MSSTRTYIAVQCLAAGLLAGLVGCTSTQPIGNAPVDLQDMAKTFDCPIGRVATCERRSNERYRCYCADKETMREVLDPERR